MTDPPAPYLSRMHVDALVKAVTHYMDVGDPDFRLALEASDNLQELLAQSVRVKEEQDALDAHWQRMALFRGEKRAQP